MSVFLVLPLKRMPTIYSFPLTDAQSPFHSCIQPWTPHISTDTHATVFLFCTFLNSHVSVCLLSILRAFIPLYCGNQISA